MAAIIGGFKLWWSDRKALKERVSNIEKIAEHAVTEARLQECRVDVDAVDEKILIEIRAIREDMRKDMRLNAESDIRNAEAHQKIIETSAKRNSEIMKAILHLHNGK